MKKWDWIPQSSITQQKNYYNKNIKANADVINRMTSVVAVKNNDKTTATCKKWKHKTENTTTNIATFERRQHTLSRQTHTLYL